jgi:hypothetical protein
MLLKKGSPLGILIKVQLNTTAQPIPLTFMPIKARSAQAALS